MRLKHCSCVTLRGTRRTLHHPLRCCSPLPVWSAPSDSYFLFFPSTHPLSVNRIFNSAYTSVTFMHRNFSSREQFTRKRAAGMALPPLFFCYPLPLFFSARTQSFQKNFNVSKRESSLIPFVQEPGYCLPFSNLFTTIARSSAFHEEKERLTSSPLLLLLGSWLSLSTPTFQRNCT